MKEKTPNYMKDLEELLHKSINNANINCTHDEFVSGVKNGKIGFKVMFGEPSQLLSGKRLIVFNLICSLYIFVPLIIVPIVSYYFGNWFLLFGILVSYISSFSAAKKSKIFFLFTPLILVYWYINGFNIHHIITFYYFSSAWGYILFRTADELQFEYALQALLESSELYLRAKESNKIMIIRKEEETRKKNDDIIQNEATKFLRIADNMLFNKEFDKAIIEYTKSIKIYPFVSGYENRGIARMKIEDYEGAIKDFSKAIELMPSKPDKIKFANIYLNRGESKYQLGLKEEANLDFKESIRLRGN